MKLKDFLKEVLDLGRDDVFKVDVMDSFSFFNTDEVLQEKVLSFFKDFKHEGRFVNVEISEDKGRKKRGGKGGGKRRRDSRSREDRFSSSRRRSGNRRERQRDESGSKPKQNGSKFIPVSSDRPRRSRRRG